jgi:TPR repeat protein
MKTRPGFTLSSFTIFLACLLMLGCARHADLGAVTSKAQQGDKQAAYELGEAYAKGKGVKADAAEGAKWFLKAAKQGHPGGQFRYGMLVLGGEGVEPSPAQAYKWLSLAAKNGDTNAFRALNAVVRNLTPAQVAEGQKLADTFTPESGGAAQ